MSNEQSIFKNAAILGYLVKKLSKSFPDKQVGKTIVQKMIFLLVERGVFRFDYTMFHYGPFSSEVAGELDYTERLEIVNIAWEEDKGYFITPTEKNTRFEHLLSQVEKEKIDQIVKDYGDLSAVELSILATSVYLKNRFHTPDDKLPKVVHDIKPNYPLHYIKNIIKKGSAKFAFNQVIA